MASRSLRMPMARPAVPTRSEPSVPMATIQPSPSPPRRYAAGTRASSKKISQNISSPATSRMGRMSMPAASRSTISAVMPSCLRPSAMASGSVRTRNRPHFATCAEEIQIFWPLRT